MADSHDKHTPTATEICNAVGRIRQSRPGLGLKKVITILRDTNDWHITASRLRKLVAPGNGMNNKNGQSPCSEMLIFLDGTYTEDPIFRKPEDH